MAYFPNGTAGTMYQERYCCRCLNYRDKGDGRGPGCAVWDAHLLFNTHYERAQAGGQLRSHWGQSSRAPRFWWPEPTDDVPF